MNLETAISEVQQIIGWRSDKIAEITRALSYAQDELEKPGMTYPWWLRKVGTVTTAAGTNLYNIPVDYIQDTEERDGNIYYYTGVVRQSRTVFLDKLSFADAQKEFFGVWPVNGAATPSDQSATVQSGIPRKYVLLPTNILFYPTPDGVYNFFWAYWGTDATQAIGQENAWLANAPWVLIGQAAKKLASDLRDTEGVAAATAILTEARQNMFRSVIHREEAGRRRTLGGRL